MNMMPSIRLLLARAARGLFKELYWSLVCLIDSLKTLALALVYFLAISSNSAMLIPVIYTASEIWA